MSGTPGVQCKQVSKQAVDLICTVNLTFQLLINLGYRSWTLDIWDRYCSMHQLLAFILGGLYVSFGSEDLNATQVKRLSE